MTLGPGTICVLHRMADPQGKSGSASKSPGLQPSFCFRSLLSVLTTRSLIADSYFVYGFLKSDRYLEYAEGAKE